MNSTRFLIVGAGPTGIGAALRLQELGVSDLLLIDRETEAGGLAGSIVDSKGFTWDLGGHVQFSHYASFDRYMALALPDDGWLHHQRESWVWIADSWVPYPFQNNLHRLPTELRWKCVEGLISLHMKGKDSPKEKPQHFRDWIHQTFGDGLGEVFLYPYNFKVWAFPLEMMGYRWVGERVAVPPLDRVLRNVCLEKDDVSWGPNNTFQFPKHGGTGSIWRSLIKQVRQDKLKLGVELLHIDAKRRLATLSDGSEVNYEHLISTLPANVLVRMLEMPELIRASEKLLHSSTHIVGVGLNGRPPESLRTKCWMYFPEANCPFYRVTVFSNYSPYNVPSPESQWSLMAEVSESPHKPIEMNGVIEDVINGMIATKMIADRSAIVSTWHRRLEYGYPTPGRYRDEGLEVIQPALEKLGIWSRGRFGAWKYEVSNQDHSFAQGREVIDRLLNQIDPEAGVEPTINRSDWVNGRRNA